MLLCFCSFMYLCFYGFMVFQNPRIARVRFYKEIYCIGDFGNCTHRTGSKPSPRFSHFVHRAPSRCVPLVRFPRETARDGYPSIPFVRRAPHFLPANVEQDGRRRTKPASKQRRTNVHSASRRSGRSTCPHGVGEHQELTGHSPDSASGTPFRRESGRHLDRPEVPLVRPPDALRRLSRSSKRTPRTVAGRRRSR